MKDGRSVVAMEIKLCRYNGTSCNAARVVIWVVAGAVVVIGPVSVACVRRTDD
jgi:hypothetical protein